MPLIPHDISTFIYCPYLFYIGKRIELFQNKKTLFEECIVKSIKEAEISCTIKETDLSARKIISKWDKIWWPEIAKQKEMSFKEAQALSTKASNLFVDYCKYDIAGPEYPTLGIDVTSEVKIGHSIIRSSSNIVKTNLNLQKRNAHVIEFSNIKKTTKNLVLDPAVRTLLYTLYSGSEIAIAYTYLYFTEKTNRFITTSIILRQDNMNEIRKMLTYIEQGIRNKVKFMNQWNCGECKQCKNFKF